MGASWGRAPGAERGPYTVWAPGAAWHLVRSSVRCGHPGRSGRLNAVVRLQAERPALPGIRGRADQ